MTHFWEYISLRNYQILEFDGLSRYTILNIFLSIWKYFGSNIESMNVPFKIAVSGYYSNMQINKETGCISSYHNLIRKSTNATISSDDI